MLFKHVTAEIKRQRVSVIAAAPRQIQIVVGSSAEVYPLPSTGREVGELSAKICKIMGHEVNIDGLPLDVPDDHVFYQVCELIRFLT